MKSHMTDLSNECASRSKESKDTTSKKSFRVIPRDQWANIGLEPNVTDLEQLETPLQAGVVAHHSGNIANRCFTIRMYRNYKELTC